MTVGSLCFVIAFSLICCVLRPLHTEDELRDELMGQIDEFVHELNQCTVPNGGVHTCFSIRPPIRPGTTKMGFVDKFTPNCFVIRDESNSSLVWMGL